MKGIVSFIRAFQYQAYHLLCCGRHTLITDSNKCNTLTIPNVVIWRVMPGVDFDLQDVQAIYIMRNLSTSGRGSM